MVTILLIKKEKMKRICFCNFFFNGRNGWIGFVKFRFVLLKNVLAHKYVH